MERGNLCGHGGARSVRLPEARTTPGRADRPEVAGFHMENERASVGGRHLAQRRRRRPTALVAAACILLVLALGIGGFVLFVNQPAQSLACRSGDVPLQVVVSPDQAGVVSQAAAEYERRRPVADNRCVDVRVKATDSVEAAAALSTGWDEATHGAKTRRLGPGLLGLGAPGRAPAAGRQAAGADPPREPQGRHHPDGDGDAQADGPGPRLAAAEPRLQGPAGGGDERRGLGQVQPSGVGGLPARQDRRQPVDARAGGADRGRVRGHRADQRALGRDPGQAGGPAPPGHPRPRAGPRPGRRHARDLPGQPPAGRPGGPDPRLRLGRAPGREVGLGLQPRQRRRPRGRRLRRQARGPPGRGLPQGGDAGGRPPVGGAARPLGRRHQARGGRRLPRLPAQRAGPDTLPGGRVPDLRGPPRPPADRGQRAAPRPAQAGAGPAGPQGGGGGPPELERGPQAQQRAGRLRRLRVDEARGPGDGRQDQDGHRQDGRRPGPRPVRARDQPRHLGLLLRPGPAAATGPSRSRSGRPTPGCPTARSAARSWPRPWPGSRPPTATPACTTPPWPRSGP